MTKYYCVECGALLGQFGIRCEHCYNKKLHEQMIIEKQNWPNRDLYNNERRVNHEKTTGK